MAWGCFRFGASSHAFFRISRLSNDGYVAENQRECLDDHRFLGKSCADIGRPSVRRAAGSGDPRRTIVDWPRITYLGADKPLWTGIGLSFRRDLAFG